MNSSGGETGGAHIDFYSVDFGFSFPCPCSGLSGIPFPNSEYSRSYSHSLSVSYSYAVCLYSLCFSIHLFEHNANNFVIISTTSQLTEIDSWLANYAPGVHDTGAAAASNKFIRNCCKHIHTHTQLQLHTNDLCKQIN